MHIFPNRIPGAAARPGVFYAHRRGSSRRQEPSPCDCHLMIPARHLLAPSLEAPLLARHYLQRPSSCSESSRKRRCHSEERLLFTLSFDEERRRILTAVSCPNSHQLAKPILRPLFLRESLPPLRLCVESFFAFLLTRHSFPSNSNYSHTYKRLARKSNHSHTYAK